MEKKEYNGLAVEVISFGSDDITTTVVPELSGCYLGSVQLYTEDKNGKKMPLGVCWVSEEIGYSFTWAVDIGTVIVD